MTQDVIKQSYRGVRCLSCRQPIPVPAILAKADATLSGQSSASAEESYTRVFSLRCRACNREKPYCASDIVEFEGSPRPRVLHTRPTQSNNRRPGALARAANA